MHLAKPRGQTGVPCALYERLLTPHILECVKAYATLGEIIGVLRETWGEHVEQNII
jgi:methylmalonyl-CoA mutase N-terminal domain/subunit